MLSELAQCFHLEFAIEELSEFAFAPGQFVSCIAADSAGKQQTRAYSIASAPYENTFDLCVNRVEGGFFSNLLCDLNEGETIACNGPHGTFTLQEPRTETLLIATGTGVAPMRGFMQWLFPEGAPNRTAGKRVWLIYGTRYEADVYYREYFEALARQHANFHYIATLSRGQQDWTGARGYVQEHVASILREQPTLQPSASPSVGDFDSHAYVCGLNAMVKATRERITSLGWHRKQVLFERYD